MISGETVIRFTDEVVERISPVFPDNPGIRTLFYVALGLIKCGTESLMLTELDPDNLIRLLSLCLCHVSKSVTKTRFINQSLTSDLSTKYKYLTGI